MLLRDVELACAEIWAGSPSSSKGFSAKLEFVKSCSRINGKQSLILEKEKGEEEGAGGNDTIDTLQSYTTALHLGKRQTEEKDLQRRLRTCEKMFLKQAKALLEDAARDALV